MTRAERDLLLLVAGIAQRVALPHERYPVQQAIEAVTGGHETPVSDERLCEIVVLREVTDEVIAMAQELLVHRARTKVLHNPKE